MSTTESTAVESLNFQQLAADAAAVAQEAADAAAAHQARREAEARLLDTVVGQVRPALKAISSRPQVSYRDQWHDNAYTSDKVTHADWAGVLVAGDRVPGRDHPRDNDGAYEGWGLYLLPDGSWRELTFEGYWSKWQGVSSSWEAKSKAVTTAEVVAEHNAENIIVALSEAIAKAKGTRANSTAKAKARAEKLAAVAALLAAK
jgi:hypothetical protein